MSFGYLPLSFCFLLIIIDNSIAFSHYVSDVLQIFADLVFSVEFSRSLTILRDILAFLGRVYLQFSLIFRLLQKVIGRIFPVTFCFSTLKYLGLYQFGQIISFPTASVLGLHRSHCGFIHSIYQLVYHSPDVWSRKIDVATCFSMFI